MHTIEEINDFPLIGRMSPEEVVAKLREMGDEASAVDLERLINSAYSTGGVLGSSNRGTEGVWLKFWPRPWNASHIFGYVSPSTLPSNQYNIVSANRISPDTSLQNASINITLDHFHIADYPGLGTHKILLEFYIQNLGQSNMESIHFSIFAKARQGENATIYNYPLFVGFPVEKQGILFGGRTVNVVNSTDEAFLSFLESDAFKSGLQFVSTVQPVIAPFSTMTYNLTKYVAKRFRNVGVQEFNMGLDFTTFHGGGERLAEGFYLAIQCPQHRSLGWDWNQWEYHPDPGPGVVVNKVNPDMPFPYNYLMFTITKCAIA